MNSKIIIKGARIKIEDTLKVVQFLDQNFLSLT